MANGLARRLGHLGDLYEKIFINVWDIAAKQVVFTGDRSDVGDFLGIALGHVSSGLSRKHKIKSKRDGKKYVLRRASTINQ